MKTAEDLKKNLSDLGVNYECIASDDWNSWPYSRAKTIVQERNIP
jgi:hypothetical protein